MDISDTGDTRDLRVLLKPLFFVMKLSGLYYTPDSVKQTTVQTLTGKESLRMNRIKDIFWNNIWKAYSIFVLALVWVMMIKCLVAMFWQYGDTEFKIKWSILKAVVLGYNLQGALEASLLFRMFHRRDRYHKFIQDWYEFSIEAAACGCPQDKVSRRLKKVFMRYFVSFMILYIFLQVGILGCLFGPDGVSKEAMLHLVDPFPRKAPFYILIGILTMLIETPWMCVILLFVATSKGLALQFKNLTFGLNKAITESPNVYPPDLPALRLSHLKLCDFVALIEQDFKLILAVAYCLNILISLLLGYSMVKTDFEGTQFLLLGFWLVCNMSKVYVLSLCSSQLHDTAQEPMVALFKVNPTGITADQSTNLELFILKLQGTSIGFTVWDFMLVRRETILTVKSQSDKNASSQYLRTASYTLAARATILISQKYSNAAIRLDSDGSVPHLLLHPCPV
ncbi:hypothetical protein LOTGIDRAFT_168741 [Lottia gigantea]|uniref:Odorant receptor n=1 Tax=Lottia gigantea TaxID=225164 RepID=V3ZP73_LOTGI|nr:hypothetical protein LOTGIDRAFT_168741 [Lottia gigantea]ESO84300.1 hypothetical protein LOTGIDRAFT_168741 [Lottia gigantea]